MRIIQRIQWSFLPGGRVVKNIVILLSEGLANLLVLRVERHDGSKVNFSENLLIPCNYPFERNEEIEKSYYKNVELQKNKNYT